MPSHCPTLPRRLRPAAALALATALSACQSTGVRPPPILPPTAAAATANPVQAAAAPGPGPARWTEGRIGVDDAGRAALLCRTERGDFLAVAPQGHPLLGSQGDRAHIEHYLDGENVWHTAFHPVTTLADLWDQSDHAGARDYAGFGLSGLARAAGAAGADKRKHFEVSYGLMMFSREGDDVLDNQLLGSLEALAIGLDKELRDRSITGAPRAELEAALNRTAAEMRTLLGQIRALHLDRGDLVADVSGLSFGAAVKGVQWLEAGAP